MQQFQDGESRTIGGVTYVRQGGQWVSGGAAPAPIYGAAKPADPYKARDQELQETAAARAEREAAERRARDERDFNYRVQRDATQDRRAEAKTGDPKLVEAERTAAFLATRIAGGMQDINAALADDPSAAKPGFGATVAGVFGDEARNWANSAERQRVEAAQMDVLDAALTLGTGAAYTREQLEGYRGSYFPKLTDDAATVADKKDRLARVLAAAKLKAGNAAPQIDAALAALNGGVAPPAAGDIRFGGQSEPEGVAKGWRMTPEQTQQFSGYLKASGGNVTPEVVASAYASITGGAGLSPEDAAEVAKFIASGGDPSKIGVDYTKSDEAKARELIEREDATGLPDNISDAERIVTAGATLGLSDEAAGVGNMIVNGVTAPFTDTNLDLGGAYTTGRDAERIRNREARQRLGGAGTALEIGGGMMSGNVSNALAIAPTLGGRVMQGVRAGATGGAIGGFGYGDGMNSLATAAGGAALGAGLGAALPVAANVVSNRVGGIARLTGRDPALPRRIVNEAIEADGSTPAAVGQVMDEAVSRGSPMMMADTGDNARALLASVGRQPGPSRTLTRNAVQGRQDAQAERISAAVVRDLGPTANIREMGEELIERARTDASPLYDKALSAPGASVVKLDDLATRPSFRKALFKAADIAVEEGEDATALGFQFNEAGDVLLERVPSFKTLDYIKRGMDDVVESYRDKTTGKLVLDGQGRATNASLRTLIARMDKVNPAYAEARAAYAGPAKMKEAMDKGFKALNRSPDDIMEMMKDMGDSQKEAFRLGIRKSIVDLLGSKRDGGDKVAHLIGTPKSRAVLSRVFGGRREFDRFVATLRDEEAMGRTYKSVAGNSATAERLAQDAQSNDTGLAETAMDVALRGSKDGPWTALIGAFQKLREVDRFGAGQAGERTRESIAALLSETDPVVLRELVAAANQAARAQGIKTRRQSRGAARLGRDVGVSTGAALGRQTEPRK